VIASCAAAACSSYSLWWNVQRERVRSSRIRRSGSPRPRALDEVAVDGIVDAFQLQAGHRLDHERAADVVVGVGRDEDAAIETQ